MIVEKLMNNGLDPHLGVINRRHNFGLALDICYIMGGLSDLQTLQFFSSCRERNLIEKTDDHWIVTDEGIKDIVHRFENKRMALLEKVENIIDEIFVLMREMSQ